MLHSENSRTQEFKNRDRPVALGFLASGVFALAVLDRHRLNPQVNGIDSSPKNHAHSVAPELRRLLVPDFLISVSA
jgi:hypothetical protein